MSRFVLAFPAVAISALLIAFSPDGVPSASAGQQRKAKNSADATTAGIVLADKNLKVEVWATEPLLANPVCFSFDENGRCFVVETYRHTQGVPDTRGKPWLDDDLACRTVADRVALYKKYRYDTHPENSEKIKLLWDSTGSGRADKSTVFADGFNRPEDGIAAGVLARKGSVYFTCIPDLYLLQDPRGENRATGKKSLASGFGVHIQYIGHDLHGLILGPDGKLYMSVGDRGFNITTKEGKKLFNPDSGAVLRCDLDGGNLEIVHIGLRNPQELAFDDHGNLFTFDNNSDSGDRARWVYIVEGGDSGWRGGFQYGTGYHTPGVPQGNRGPWNTEKLWLPQWDGQAAYIVPPLLNFGDGPSGIAHYPGVGLSDKYKDHFFASDFRGGPGGSKIWSLAVKPKGAAFEVVDGPKQFISNMLPTDCAFGPDGAFYWSDWTTGWDKPGKGRIFRVTDPEAMKNPQVAEAKELIAEGFEKKSDTELAKLLEFPHQQVRQEAQFELASRKPEDATRAFATVLKDSKNRIARLHAIWGLGMIARTNLAARMPLVDALRDPDSAIVRPAIEQLGTARVPASSRTDPVIGPVRDVTARMKELTTGPDPRVRAAAAVTYGKLAGLTPPKFETVDGASFLPRVAPLFDMLKANDDKDPYLRHAAVVGLYYAAHNPANLVNAWHAAREQARDKYNVPSVRMGVLLALRKHYSDKVGEFLSDAEPRIVAEVARAIYDTRLMNAFPALAKLADSSAQPDAVAFRALAANFWLGTSEAAARVAKFAGRLSEPDYTRAFALQLLGDWGSPPRRDPIMGVTMSLENRDAKPAAEALRSVGVRVFAGSEAVRREAALVTVKFDLKEFGPALAELARDAKQPISTRVQALYAVEALRDPAVNELAAVALEANNPKLRAAGRAVKARLEPAVVLHELPALLNDTAVSFIEKQGAFAILAAQRRSPEVDKLLSAWLDRALAGQTAPEITFDLLEAAEIRANTPRLKLDAPLKQKVEMYRAAQAKLTDKLAPYLESVAGGDAEKGRAIFLNNSAVYCQRCHKLDGQGGEVGPQLNGIAADKEKDRRYLLESVVYPSAKIAKGFETVILVLTDERTVSGIIKSEDKKQIKLVTPENKEIVVAVEDVAARRTGPSAMPADLHTKLSRRELRDVVEFLASLKKPLKKGDSR